jgi:hypothetical protein
MVPWQYGKPPAKLKPKISKSTEIGMTKVQKMIAEPSVPGEGISLLEFLQREEWPESAKIPTFFILSQ